MASEGKTKMKVIKRAGLTLGFVLAFWASHATAQQDYLSRFNAQLKSTRAAVEACVESIKDDPRVIRFRDEFVPHLDGPNRYSLLGSINKLNPEQKNFMQEALPFLTKCRSVHVEGEAGLPVQPITVESYRRLDLIYGRLLRGEITIGEANNEIDKSNEEVWGKYRKRYAELKQQVQQPSVPPSASPGGSSDSDSSSLLRLMIQQQILQDANSAADTRNRELIDAIKPSPSQTDCTRDGWDNVKCTTR
jgi:hypothetical protein